jgi:hypothetical protein
LHSVAAAKWTSKEAARGLLPKPAEIVRPMPREGRAMIEFRWVVFLACWTLLIGPVVDFTQTAPTAQQELNKSTPAKRAVARK